MSNNLTVFADAQINGGEYDKIKVFGAADILGDVTAHKIHVFGSTDFKGKCKIDIMKLYGSCDFKEYVEVNELDVKGSCEFNDDIKCDILRVYGSVDFNKKLFRCKEVKIYGEANVSKLEADEIYINGYVDCSDQLNGEKVQITTNHGSKIKEMVGTEIIVKPSKKLFLKTSSQQVEIDMIEGDDIYLENVIAKEVRGNKVIVGPNCKIELVEYHDEYENKSNKGVEKVEKL